jgi:hypothetical protein
MSTVTANLKLEKSKPNESSAQIAARHDANLDVLDAGGAAAGSNKQVQFNDGGILGGNSALSFDKATGILTLGGLKIATGTGDPSGVLAAPVGSLFLRSDGGTSTALYVKETGAATTSGWVAK